jgi:hypothetical protein
MNIFIVIIEQGYMSVKYKKAYDWLDDEGEGEEDG